MKFWLVFRKFQLVCTPIPERCDWSVQTHWSEGAHVWIRYIQAISDKIISLPTRTSTPDNIGDVVNIPLRSEWYNSIFSNYEKMATPKTSSAPFLCSSLPPDKIIIRTRISFRVNNLHWQPIWTILKNMWIWIIHYWSSWLHSIIHTCVWHPLPPYYHSDCLCRGSRYICIGHLQ